MGSLNPFGGSGSTASSGGTGNPYTGQLGNLAALETGYAQPFLQGGTSQYEAGLSGQLTPAQQALTQFTLGENQQATNARYGSLGLGNSTMNTQDQNANNLTSLAQQEQIDFANEQAGLAAEGAGAGLLGQAGTNLGNAGQQYNTGYNTTKQGLTSLLGGSGGSGGILGSLLGGNSAGGSGGLGGILGGLLGGNQSAGASSLAGLVGTNAEGPGVASATSNAISSGSGIGDLSGGLGDVSSTPIDLSSLTTSV